MIIEPGGPGQPGHSSWANSPHCWKALCGLPLAESACACPSTQLSADVHRVYGGTPMLARNCPSRRRTPASRRPRRSPSSSPSRRSRSSPSRRGTSPCSRSSTHTHTRGEPPRGGAPGERRRASPPFCSTLPPCATTSPSIPIPAPSPCSSTSWSSPAARSRPGSTGGPSTSTSSRFGRRAQLTSASTDRSSTSPPRGRPPSSARSPAATARTCASRASACAPPSRRRSGGGGAARRW